MKELVVIRGTGRTGKTSPPGIGCPLIASVPGASLVPAVAELDSSAAADIRRLWEYM